MKRIFLLLFCLFTFACAPKVKVYRTSVRAVTTTSAAEPESISPEFLKKNYPYSAFTGFKQSRLSQNYEQVKNLENEVPVTSLLHHVNKLRKRRGLKPLKPSFELSETAKMQSAYMFITERFSHDNHLYPGLVDRAAQVKGLGPEPFHYLNSVAENIYMMRGYNLENLDEEELAKDMINSYADSKGHLANMLSKSSTHFGAYTVLYEGKLYNTCFFAGFNQ
jgi:uncharacterized protein YkwD